MMNELKLTLQEQNEFRSLLVPKFSKPAGLVYLIFVFKDIFFTFNYLFMESASSASNEISKAAIARIVVELFITIGFFKGNDVLVKALKYLTLFVFGFFIYSSMKVLIFALADSPRNMITVTSAAILFGSYFIMTFSWYGLLFKEKFMKFFALIIILFSILIEFRDMISTYLTSLL